VKFVTVEAVRARYGSNKDSVELAGGGIGEGPQGRGGIVDGGGIGERGREGEYFEPIKKC